jgi:hypothetical protein
MSRNVPIPEGDVETDCLIVGAGPAGASLACFLVNYGELNGPALARKRLTRVPLEGVKVMLISDAPGTTATPRAHLLNMAGLGRRSSHICGIASCALD